MSLRDKIFACDDVPTKLVEVPEWGGITVAVKGFDYEASEAFQAKFADQVAAAKAAKDAGEDPEKAVDTKDFTIFLVTECCFDPETGEKIFRPEDAARLRRKAAAAVSKLVKTALALSGFGADAVDQAGKSSSAPSATTQTSGPNEASQPSPEATPATTDSSSGSGSGTDGGDPSESSAG